MNTSTWRNVFSEYHSKLNRLIKSSKHLSTSTKLCTKKQFRMQNKFAFQGVFKKQIANENNSTIISPNSTYEQNDYEQQFGDSTYTSNGGFVSGDLLANNKKRMQQKIIPHKEKSRKPVLRYKGEILFGIHPIYLALSQKRRVFHHLYTREELNSSIEEENPSQKNKIIRLAKSMNIPVSSVDSRGLRILAPDTVHQGMCLDAGFLPLTLWNEAECKVDTSEDVPLWLVLDEILDPMNVGAIIRSAHYFGVNKLFTVIGNSCKLSPTVSKASSGTLEVMDVYQVGNLHDFIKKRKEDGWCIVSTIAYSTNTQQFNNSTINADQFNTSKPTILILGNEGRGVSESVLGLCDSLISIEPGQTLPNGIDSLNVSVATGIILYALKNSKKINR